MTTRVQAGEFCAVKTTREDGTFSRANFTSIVSVILTRHRALRILSAQSAPKHTPSRNTKPNAEISTRMPAIKYARWWLRGRPQRSRRRYLSRLLLYGSGFGNYESTPGNPISVVPLFESKRLHVYEAFE